MIYLLKNLAGSESMNEERWNAVKNNDKSYEGKFYYGVKTTGIFCLPSCKSKLPLRKNVMFFHSYQEAINTGFRPCKRCRPDLSLTYDPNKELLDSIKNFLDENFTDAKCLDGLDRYFNVSKFHLIRIFKNKFGKTPREYVQYKRIELSKNILISSDIKTIDIAFISGFSSYTTFFTNFKNLTNMTPEEYRKDGNI